MKYNSVLSMRCRVGNLSLSISCRVGEYFFVCVLTFGKLSVGELSYNDCFYKGIIGTVTLLKNCPIITTFTCCTDYSYGLQT